ncbi:hypothetical protein BC739_006446 [Kutzneria viridogrisea]|uniref:DUF2020 domain-containing protein n=2 Tax=Kutzneria TaxID=43356 RepID=A0ABR6BR28_9PSEU|nr:DUF2020 domain-containing protein [Kutzneria albida]AHH93387.1 putative secreted protein [Kutzneria albida DSM 43870]MBA8929228.1 hypothetical protein [Kutzneria viridogrisea]
MRRVGVVGGFLVLGLAACSSPGSQPAPTSTTASSSAPATTSAAAVPGTPQPAADGQCPYLSSEFVADANGEKVTKVQVSADKPHPACFFYSFGNSKQVTVQVYVGDAAAAKGLVDRAAPVKTSDKAELTGGWEGGSLSAASGAVYAVAKGGSAVVVNTDQKQTIKAKQIVKQAISALGL